ncbi:ATP-binding protein [Propionispora vibrioides]|uniref:Uncharacterized protein YPO0396 n=1 Tax=Propionispora vibrioides TaxID=112903 RepID=A0A1H8SJH1_9FIRM|nr:ATP-binding protein [Propionispora vibrioides]SEO78343.1 Uncharacterized protein YPO0396 [Propionispora vibrioides]
MRDLFNCEADEAGMLFGHTPGFRLHKLEVYNWGTFDGQVWTFTPKGQTALLTGDVGSGKSTLVDALSTLLVSPRKVTYNKAADSSAKERSVASYVKGYFGMKRSGEGQGLPDALRDANSYSVLLAVYFDKGLSQYVTLAQVFWFADAQKPPQRFYVVADREMKIADDFSKFQCNMKILRKRLKSDDKVQVLDDYTRYANIFCRKFGIAHEQALDLFQQTISMKKVESLTEFVRANMLEEPNTPEDVEKLISHFHDLDRAHEAVLKAKEQISLLQPIVRAGKKYEQLQGALKQFVEAGTTLAPWVAAQVLRLLITEINEHEQTLQFKEEERHRTEVELNNNERDLEALNRNIYQNGGGALEELKQAIEQNETQWRQMKDIRHQYVKQAGVLQLLPPDSSEAFRQNFNKLFELREYEVKIKDQLDMMLVEQLTEQKRIEDELTHNTSELESLRSRKTSIPRNYIEKRWELCQSLNIAEQEIPFVGELLEIKPEEATWEGALERLLHNFGLSMLVPEKYYRSVAEWVDKTNLGLRFVYYRVHEEKRQPLQEETTASVVADKLVIKPDTSFGSWLSQELFQRYRYVCCETIEEFRHERYAVTKAGQIKVNGKRHEKDDRRALDDRRNFILGFSNQKKVAALEEAVKQTQDQLQQVSEELLKIRERQKRNEAKLDAVKELERIKAFSEIDTVAKEQEIAEKKERQKQLEEENDILKALQEQLKNLTEKKKQQEKRLIDLKSKEETLKDKLKSLKEDYKNSQMIVEQATEAMREKDYAFLEKNKMNALKDQSITLRNAALQERNYRDWLDGERDSLNGEIQKTGQTVVSTMSSYRHKYLAEMQDIDASIEAFVEYEKILEKLEKDGLPNFERRFKELLHTNAINQIALFQQNLYKAQKQIRDRIDQINDSLNNIDYNPDRYIRIEYDETHDSDIKDFRVRLRTCTEGFFGSEEEEQYTEAKFLQVKEIIERFRGREGENETDARWTKKVIDVRNWFLFSASERWRETDEEYEHYTDSGGKSGGQKEKLAYTILAASLVYHFGLKGQNNHPQSFRFVVIDEAFLKSSDESARFGLNLFQSLDLQLMIVTPLLKIPTISKFVSHVGLVHHDDVSHQSMVRNITIEEFEKERKLREAARYVKMV